VNLLATALPEHSNDGYVAAAYIVFFAIILIYVAIMAVRLERVERKIRALEGTGELDAREPEKERTLKGAPPRGGHPEGHERAGETV
jgi:hypothetical protein